MQKLGHMFAQPWTVDSLKDNYDLVVAALGFEKRARYICEKYAISGVEKIAWPFMDRQVFSYAANRRWFLRNNYNIDIFDVSDVEQIIRRQTAGRKVDRTASILVDVSSFNRVRLAQIVEILRNLEPEHRVEVDFVYSLAQFSKPVPDISQGQQAGPVIPSFAGWESEPESPPLAIVGVGYEENLALGAIEHVQATNIWIFVPVSPIARYSEELAAANAYLFDILRDRAIEYQVINPYKTFIMLESLVNSVSETGNPLLFPFGPKIFYLVSLIVATIHRNCGVWRVSTGAESPPRNRLPSEYVMGIRVVF